MSSCHVVMSCHVIIMIFWNFLRCIFFCCSFVVDFVSFPRVRGWWFYDVIDVYFTNPILSFDVRFHSRDTKIKEKKIKPSFWNLYFLLGNFFTDNDSCQEFISKLLKNVQKVKYIKKHILISNEIDIYIFSSIVIKFIFFFYGFLSVFWSLVFLILIQNPKKIYKKMFNIKLV